MFVLKRKFKNIAKKKGLFGGKIKSMAEIKQLSNKIKHIEAKEEALIEAAITQELAQI